MKSTGIVRKVDELGRVVVPMELRRALGIESKDPVEIFVEGNKIVLQKYMPNVEKENVVEALKNIAANASEQDKETIQRAINIIK